MTEPDSRDPLTAADPATVLLHKPAGVDSTAAASLIVAGQRWAGDATGIQPLPEHFLRQVPAMPLETAASGLLFFSQDPRRLRWLREDASHLEQEFNVEVTGAIVAGGLRHLEHGLSYLGRFLPPTKVSWQNETRLRFAIKDVRDGQLAYMCAAVGLAIVSIKRLRIGRVSLAKIPAGEWRYLPTGEKI